MQDPSLAPAAVLVLLYPKDGEYCVLLNKRTEEVEHHKGEISFPGGAKDPKDASFLETALRETQEEMGIRPEDVTMLGELDEQVTRTHFNVRVYVGTIPYPYPFVPSSSEIAEVLEAPIRDLLDPANRREELRSEGGEVSRVQSYLYGDHLVFGATARILTQFLELLENGAGVKDGGR